VCMEAAMTISVVGTWESKVCMHGCSSHRQLEVCGVHVCVEPVSSGSR
jgi:hypothetical protein